MHGRGSPAGAWRAASDALDTPRATSASRTMHRVNDRWSTRSGVRVSAPDIAVGGSDRRRRDRQREVRPCAAEDWPGRFRFRNHFGRPKICTGTRTRKVKPVALPSEILQAPPWLPAQSLCTGTSMACSRLAPSCAGAAQATFPPRLAPSHAGAVLTPQQTSHCSHQHCDLLYGGCAHCPFCATAHRASCHIAFVR